VQCVVPPRSKVESILCRRTRFANASTDYGFLKLMRSPAATKLLSTTTVGYSAKDRGADDQVFSVGSAQ
jgi:hypothetical protein